MPVDTTIFRWTFKLRHTEICHAPMRMLCIPSLQKFEDKSLIYSNLNSIMLLPAMKRFDTGTYSVEAISYFEIFGEAEYMGKIKFP